LDASPDALDAPVADLLVRCGADWPDAVAALDRLLVAHPPRVLWDAVCRVVVHAEACRVLPDPGTGPALAVATAYRKRLEAASAWVLERGWARRVDDRAALVVSVAHLRPHLGILATPEARTGNGVGLSRRFQAATRADPPISARAIQAGLDQFFGKYTDGGGGGGSG
jgi:hypothetical protein